MIDIYEDESLDDLEGIGMKIIQKKDGFRFSIDSVLIAWFVRLSGRENILEIGTGSGIIPLQLAYMYPKVNILAVEIQENIAHMARRSIAYNKLDNRISLINKDIKEFKLEDSHMSKIDCIITNPPYMKLDEGKISENKVKATSRHELKLNLEELLSESKRLLKVGGSLNIIYRSNRFYELLKLLERYSFSPKRLRFIYSKKGTESVLFMVEVIKASKCSLSIMEPLYIFDENNSYTDEVESYYR